MKIFSLFLSFFLIFSFSVTVFADDVLVPLPDDVSSSSEVSWEASSGNDYLDILLNNIQNDISDLESDVKDINEQLSTFSVDDSSNVDSSSDSSSDVEVNPDLGLDDSVITNISVYSVSPITPDDSSGLKAILLDILGDYDSIVVEYEYQNSNGYYNYLREIQPDYVWLCSAAIFLVIIYSVFRLGGALFRG